MWNPFHHDDKKDEQAADQQAASQNSEAEASLNSSLETPEAPDQATGVTAESSTDAVAPEQPADSPTSDVAASEPAPAETTPAPEQAGAAEAAGTVDEQAAVTEAPVEQPAPGAEVSPEGADDSAESGEEQNQQ